MKRFCKKFSKNTHTQREREREREREKKKKKHSSTLIHDDFAWVAVQSRSLEQLMDQDSINIDNGENQANKRPWYWSRSRIRCLRINLHRGTQPSVCTVNDRPTFSRSFRPFPPFCRHDQFQLSAIPIGFTRFESRAPPIYPVGNARCEFEREEKGKREEEEETSRLSRRVFAVLIKILSSVT